MNETRLVRPLLSHRASFLVISSLMGCALASGAVGCGVQIVTSRDVGVDMAVALLDTGGIDGGTDSGRDTGVDTGVDTGIDMGIDAGLRDMGVDAPVVMDVGVRDAPMPSDACGADTNSDGAPGSSCGIDGGPPPGSVNLGICSTYAVMAGSTVVNTGPTIITGDMGLSPGSAVVGFPPGIVIGTMHITDTMAAACAVDLTAAYNDAAGRTLAPISISGNIGGMTLVGGLYKSTSGMAISGGDLTLDGGGGSTSVWIFQMASTFVMTAGRQVILTNGAQANNVYWQVGTSATIQAGASCFGTLMADQSITLQTGATLRGRALTRIGGVTLDANAITVP